MCYNSLGLPAFYCTPLYFIALQLPRATSQGGAGTICRYLSLSAAIRRYLSLSAAICRYLSLAVAVCRYPSLSVAVPRPSLRLSIEEVQL